MTMPLDDRLRGLPPDAFHDLLVKIAEIDAFRGWWEGRNPFGASALDRMKRRAIEVSARVSTQISSRGLSDVRREALGSRRGAGNPEGAGLTDEAGYRELLGVVFDGHKDMQFGEELLLQLHARLLRYSAKDQRHRGKYKTVPEPLSPYRRRPMESPALRPTSPDLVPREMKVATEWAANRLGSAEFHPLLVSANFILEFLAIRPFADGNGRLSRALTNFLLLRSGYAYVPYASLEKVIADKRRKLAEEEARREVRKER